MHCGSNGNKSWKRVWVVKFVFDGGTLPLGHSTVQYLILFVSTVPYRTVLQTLINYGYRE